MIQTMTRVAASMLLFVGLFLVGCGESNEPTNVADGAGADEIAEYERMIQEAEEADNAAGESEGE
jgi:hypothetical protein